MVGKSLVNRQKFGWYHWIPTCPMFTLASWDELDYKCGELVTGAKAVWSELTANHCKQFCSLIMFSGVEIRRC